MPPSEPQPFHPESDAIRNRTKSFLSHVQQLIRIKLLRPLTSLSGGVDYNARGVSLGIFIAMSPTIGLQIPLLALIWYSLRALGSRWQFNLLIASAWTLTTNVVTAPPLYYVYVVTGRIMLGRWEELRGYDTFHHRLSATQPDNVSLADGWLNQLHELFNTFGIPLAVGWLPWAIIACWIGHRWALSLLRKREQRRTERNNNEAATRDK